MDKICVSFYNKNIRGLIGDDFTKSEHDISLEVFKSLTQNIWSDKIMNTEQKMEYFDGYNKNNLVKILCSIINFYRLNNITNYIPMRDITLLPSSWLFINQEIEAKDTQGNPILKKFNTTPIFNTGDFKIGTQKGKINSQGVAEIEYMEHSSFDIDKTYILASILESKDSSYKTVDSNLFIDYYLGNISLK